MLNRIKDLISFPAFDDPKETFRARTISYIILIGLLLLLGSFIINLFNETPPIRYLMNLLVGSAFISIWIVLRSRRVQLSSYLVAFLVLVILTVLSVISGGIDSPIFSGNIIVILLAGSLLGVRAGLIFTVFSGIIGLVFMLVEITATLPPPLFTYPAESKFYIYFSFILATAVLHKATTTSLQNALQQAKKEVEEREKAEMRLSRHSRELALLHKTRTAFSQEQHLDGVIKTVVEAIGDTFGFPLVSIYLIRNRVLHLAHQIGYAHVIESVPLTKGVLGRVARTGQPVLLKNTKVDPDFIEAFDGISSEMAVPIFNRDVVVGVLNVESGGERQYTEEDLDLMIELGKYVSIAFERGRLYSEIKESETRYKMLFELSPFGTNVHIDGEIVLINPAGLQMIGGKTPEDIVGKRVLDFIHPQSRDQFKTRLNREGHFNKELPWVEDKFVRLDGTDFDVVLMDIPFIFQGKEAMQTFFLDISERVQAESSLRKSEERYRTLFENSSDAIFILAEDSTIIAANQIGAKLFGFEIHEMIGRKGLDLVAPEDRQSGSSRLRAAISGHPPPIYERMMIKKDGTFFPAEINLSTVYDENGTIIQAQSIIRDITQRKKAEEALRDSQQRYQALFENSNDGVFIVGLDGRLFDVSPKGAELLGLTVNEVIGHHISEFVVPEENEESNQKFQETLSGAKLPIYERKLLRKDGTIIPIEINSGLVKDLHGKAIYIQNIVRNVSERKQAEEERERLLETLKHRNNLIQTAVDVSTSSIALINVESLIHQTVDLIQDRFGYANVGLYLVDDEEKFAVLRAGSGQGGKEMIEDGHNLLIGGRSMVGWTIANKEARITLDLGEDLPHFENPILHDTRSEMALPLRIRGEVIGALSVQSDQQAAFIREDIAILQAMTDQLAIAIDNARLHERVASYAGDLAQRVIERTAELEATNQELEAFIYSVSHDLRAPLRGIDGFSRIMIEDHKDSLTPSGYRLITKVRDHAKRMNQLIDDLLSFSRLGRKRVNKRVIDPYEIVHKIWGNLEHETSGRDIIFNLKPMPSCFADPSLLEQVFANLLTNAIKFTTQRETTHIEVGAFQKDENLIYYVRDNGVGFEMKYANKLFGVFQRLHTDEEFEGTGVGLAIVQRIIQKHGGRLWAEGKPNEGATFHFTLPGGENDTPSEN